MLRSLQSPEEVVEAKLYYNNNMVSTTAAAHSVTLSMTTQRAEAALSRHTTNYGPFKGWVGRCPP